MKEDQISEFIKQAYKLGRVKNAEEVFKEYLVEEEWHKGRVENILAEESEEYNQYSVGDIVFVSKYYYENGKEGKNHLFVIIEQNNLAVPIENFRMLISSNLEKLKYNTNKLLEKNDCNGLNKDSIVKTDIIYKIKNSQILFKIGNVDIEKVNEYKRSFLETT